MKKLLCILSLAGFSALAQVISFPTGSQGGSVIYNGGGSSAASGTATNLEGAALTQVTNIANSIGGATNGVTATTATNIAAYQAALVKTNNFVYVNDFGALADNGTTDNVTAILAAIATGKEVRFRESGTNYYESSPFILTNTVLNLGSAKLKMKAGTTNFFIQMATIAHSGNSYAGTNVNWSGTKIIGGELWGGGVANTATLGTRHGVWVNPYAAANAIVGTYIHGFNGVGVQVASQLPFYTAPFLTTDMSPLVISGLTVSNCFLGYNIVGGQPYGIPATGDIYLAEYLRLDSLAAFGNFIGARLEAGNSSWANCVLSRNTNNFLIVSNQNNGHGSFVGGLINHDGAGYGILASNINNGFAFTGVLMFFTDIYFTNSSGINITGGQLDTATVTFAGGGRNEVRFNSYPNTAPSFTTIGTGTNSQWYGNYKADGSVAASGGIPADTMGSNVYNLNVSYGYRGNGTNVDGFVTGGYYNAGVAESVFNGRVGFFAPATPYGNYGAWTFDGASASRIGFVIQNGQYPKLTYAAGAPFVIAQSDGSALLTTISAQTLTKKFEIGASGITNWVTMYDVNGNPYSTNSAGGGGGGGSVATNANQFAANTTLTIKDGALVTNLVNYLPPASLSSLDDGNLLLDWSGSNAVSAGYTHGQTVTNFFANTGGNLTNAASSATLDTNTWKDSYGNGIPTIYFPGTGTCNLTTSNTLLSATTQRKLTVFLVMRATNSDATAIPFNANGSQLYMRTRLGADSIPYNNEWTTAGITIGNSWYVQNGIHLPPVTDDNSKTNYSISWIAYLRWDGTNMWAGNGLHWYEFPTDQGIINSSGPINFGDYLGSFKWKGWMSRALVYSSALTASNSVRIARQLHLENGISTNYATRVIALGDSMTQGDGTVITPYKAWPMRLSDHFPDKPIRVINMGVSSDFVSNRWFFADTTLQHLQSPGTENIWAVMIGSNDLYNQTNSSGTNVYEWNKYLGLKFKWWGAKTVFATMPPRAASVISGGPTFNTERGVFNGLMITNGNSWAGAIIHPSRMYQFGAITNSAMYQSDKIHPSAAGHEYIAAEFARGMRTVMGK